MPESLNLNANLFENNTAFYYGNNWATPPFRLCLTNSSINMSNFKPEFIIKDYINKINIKPGSPFNLDYYVWIVDQFLQPCFDEKEMYETKKCVYLFNNNRIVKLQVNRLLFLIIGITEQKFQKTSNLIL